MTSSSLVGSAFLEEIFGSEFLCSSLCVWVVFFGVFCLCFYLIMWHCSPENSQKNSLLVRCVFRKKCSGVNFCFLTSVSGWCFLLLFRLCFCFIMWHCSSETGQKNSCQVRFLEEIFGSKLLFFNRCVRLVFFVVVSPMFLLYYVALFSRKLPE